jgi:hypothetical protein
VCHARSERYAAKAGIYVSVHVFAAYGSTEFTEVRSGAAWAVSGGAKTPDRDRGLNRTIYSC